jgi:hypothetical protein
MAPLHGYVSRVSKLSPFSSAKTKPSFALSASFLLSGWERWAFGRTGPLAGSAHRALRDTALLLQAGRWRFVALARERAFALTPTGSFAW